MKKRMNNELITEYYRTATYIPKKLHRLMEEERSSIE
jgi:hypothetical protein